MSAPRKICATEPGRAGHMFANAQRLEDAPYLYHHDDVVRGLVEALKQADLRLSYSEQTFRDQGCESRADACRAVLLQIDAALAKIERGE